ncbi:hypothetical protein WDH52_19010 [Streptomyces sp. TRM70308]|uniref:hypothetical protein n=1 Tax=Streptomyces sp. TRM70308 TaxID=3131932 RepID=UPI003CFF5380
MASSPSTSSGPGPLPPPAGRAGPRPNTAFRKLRGHRSAGEFAAAIRRAAREIGEHVSCDARYVGRVEAGEIRCPNYAYERVFLHMFPGCTLADLGFAPREVVRGRAARREARPTGPQDRPAAAGPAWADATETPASRPHPARAHLTETHPTETHPTDTHDSDEESDVLRRAFMTGGPTAMAAFLGLGPGRTEEAWAAPPSASARAGESEAGAVEEAVRQIRVLDDQHGADALYQRAGAVLRGAYRMLDMGVRRRSVADRMHAGAGELAISVGWLAHDSGRFAEAHSHYAEALATSRLSDDAALEAHAFCNTAFLARDAGRPREAVRAAQAGQSAAARVGSARLSALLALREAGGRSGLGDRAGCQEALGRAQTLFARGPSDADPEWMSFFGEAELAGLEAQCWAALGEFGRAAACARRAVALQRPHFVRNTALFTAELAGDLAADGAVEEAAAQGARALDLMATVHSSRIHAMLRRTARRLLPFRREPRVAAFLARAAR